MDGINPTLAFAVLLFGLSGNAHDGTHQSIKAQIEDRAGCPTQMAHESDPVQRRTVPTAIVRTDAPKIDPCEPEQ
jgi:hypothetical protein